MATEQSELIQKSIKEGLDRHATRREFISQGMSTAGFDDAYKTVLQELGVSEPKPAMPNLRATGEIPLRFKNKNRRRMIDAAKMSVMVLLLAAAAYGAYLSVNKTNLSELVSELFNEGTNSQATEEAHVSVADSILQTKVDSTVASARIYRKRMGTYDGVCRDITVVAPVACKETNEQFVIFVPLSNATEYCVDSTGKVSNAVDPSPEAVRCN